MISTIIEALDLAASEKLTVAARNGLAELVSGVGPATYNGTDWNPIANDNAGTFSYWRLNGQVREQADESTTSCGNVFTATMPLRYVAMVDRSLCGTAEHARAAATAMRGTDKAIRAALGANIVEIRSVSVNVDSAAVARSEGLPEIEPNKALLSIDIQFVVTGRASCFDPCEDAGSFLCRVIEAQTWARIKACMTEAQIDAATDDLCDGGGGDVTITGTDGLTQLPPVDCGDTYPLPDTHIFFQDNVGQPGGVLLGLGTVVEEVDGHLYPDIVVPSRYVKNTAGNNANTFRATLEDLVNDTLPIAQDGFWSLKDTDGNELNTGSIPSNASADITAPDATVTRDGLPFGTVLSGGTIDVPSDCTPCDPELSLRLNGGRVIETLDLDCGLQEYDILVTTEGGAPIGTYDNVEGRIEVTPGQVQLQDSAANPIGSPVSIEPESGGNTITAPDGSVSINGTPVGDVLSGGSLDVPVTLDGATASGTWTGSAYDIAKQANILREYTAGATWNKPAGLKELFVLVAGAGGGGGGAGRRNGTITGASGGGGGAVRWLRIDAASLSASEVISIGAGGVGGPGGTVVAGTAGGNGGSTSFGSFIAAAGGTGGGTSATSGTITGGAGGTTAGIRFFLPGSTGGNAAAGADGSAGSNGWAQLTAGPGGGGGGASTNTPATYGGGAGGGVFEWNGSAWTLVAGPTGPAASTGNGSNGSNDQCSYLLQSFTEVPTIGLGTGGAGGAGNQGTTGGNGGNGGRAAGGGGGGSIQGLGGTGGSGGNGGNGFCILIEIY